MSLEEKHCAPCEEGGEPLEKEDIKEYRAEINTDWQVRNDKKIFRKFNFSNFQEVMEFVNEVADLAEEEGHHPDMKITYDSVVIELWTHAVGGLTENDFIMAKKIDLLI